MMVALLALHHRESHRGKCPNVITPTLPWPCGDNQKVLAVHHSQAIPSLSPYMGRRGYESGTFRPQPFPPLVVSPPRRFPPGRFPTSRFASLVVSPASRFTPYICILYIRSSGLPNLGLNSVILFCLLYSRIQAAFPIQKRPVFSQFYEIFSPT